MKISIYGCGWLGLPLAKSLLKEGHEVKGTVRSVESFNQLINVGFPVFQNSMDELENLSPEFWSCDVLIIAVLHKSIDDFETLCSVVRQEQIERVIYISSTSVYANNNNWVNEGEGPYNKQYVIYQIEQVFNWMDINTTFVRFAGLVGPNRHPGRFFAKSGRRVRQANTNVNLIYLHDCIGLIKAIIQQGKFGFAFNGCSPDHPIKQDFYTWAVQDYGESLPEFHIEKQPSYKKVDGSLVEKELGYEYQVTDFKQSGLYRGEYL